MIVAGRAAVAAAGMEVAQQLARLANGGGLVLLLDIHVERVEVQLERRAADRLDQLQRLVAGVDEVGLKAVERLHANLFAALLGIRGDRLKVLHHRLPLLLVFGGRHGVGPAHGRIHRPHHRRAIQHHHLVDHLLQVVEAVLLLLGRAAQITVRPQAGADRAADEALLVQFALYVRRVDMRGVFDGNLDAVKAPLLELLE